MVFQSKKSTDEADLEDLRIRRKSLDNCVAHARTEIDAAHEARRAMLLAGNVNDDEALTAANDRIVAAHHTEAGFDDAIEKIDVMITDAETKLAAKREHIASATKASLPPRLCN